jgi:hypothetical protein
VTGSVQLAMREMLALPPKGKPAAELTDREKIAVYVMAGVDVEVLNDGKHLTVRTLRPCGIVDRPGGGYIVGTT